MRRVELLDIVYRKLGGMHSVIPRSLLGDVGIQRDPSLALRMTTKRALRGAA
jgi:hypothetical protein